MPTNISRFYFINIMLNLQGVQITYIMLSLQGVQFTYIMLSLQGFHFIYIMLSLQGVQFLLLCLISVSCLLIYQCYNFELAKCPHEGYNSKNSHFLIVMLIKCS